MENFVQGEPIYYAHALASSFKRVRVLPFSDIHFKNPLFSEKHFIRYLHMLSVPENYGVLNGDLIEAVTKVSKGDIYKQDLSPQEQAAWMTNKLLPYKEKFLGMTMGNHEKRIYDLVGHDYCQEIAAVLGIPYRAEGLLLKVSFGSNNSGHKDKPYTYWVYMTHGYGGARTKSAKAVKAERLANWIDADVYIQSHDHVVNIAPDVYLVPDPRTHKNKDGWMVGKVRARRKMLVKSGAFLKWGGYSEMGGFPPVDLEMPIITLYGEGKPRVKVEV